MHQGLTKADGATLRGKRKIKGSGNLERPSTGGNYTADKWGPEARKLRDVRMGNSV